MPREYSHEVRSNPAHNDLKPWIAAIAASGPPPSRVLAVAKDHAKISVNVCEKGGRLYDADRAEIVWSADDIRAFCSVASVELQAALLLALSRCAA
jgi:hypothetical protein